MPEKLQPFYEEALRAPLPLAEEGVVVFETGTHHLVDTINIDRSATTTFLEERGVPQEYFRHSIIQILPYGHSDLCTGEVRRGASISFHYAAFKGRSFFPYIQLGIDPSNPDIPRLNYNFRHELGHLAHRDTGDALYARPNIVSEIRLTYLGLLGYGILPPATVPSSVTEATLTAGATCAGALFAYKPYDLLHALTPIEYRANHFAKKHKNFNPITFTDSSS